MLDHAFPTPGRSHSAAPWDPLLLSDPATPRIGPNSIIQTLKAVEALEGPELSAKIEQEAGLTGLPRDGMIPEVWFVRLVDCVRRYVPRGRSELILARSGTLTAEYVREHRIPSAVRTLLARLPGRLAVPLLLRAIQKHAWTFAGSGRFWVERGYPPTLVLENNPCCRAPATSSFLRGASGGSYYAAAFEGLLKLAAPRTIVEEVACRVEGHPHCRFQVHMGDGVSLRGRRRCS